MTHSPARPLIVGTRGSALARRQTNQVVAALRRRQPDLLIEIRAIRTTGDAEPTAPLQTIGGQGVFVKEIEAALARGEIDLAVHSLKDLPGTLAAGLVLGAVPKREDARDVVVARSGALLADLPAGAVIGTGAARRAAQLRALRPELVLRDLRGNVDTRLAKALDPAGPYDAIILALAGLKRLRRAGAATEILPFDTLLPAPGQGALGLEVRADDAWALAIVAALDHPPTRAAVTAERAFLAGLGGGCALPIAALGRARGRRLWLTGLLADDQGRIARATLFGDARAAADLGARMARDLLARIELSHPT